MKVDGGVGWDLDKVGAEAKALEEMGYSGLMTAETSHDPFFPLLVAAMNTQRIELMTGIAVAFARTPMVLANIGHDLNAVSKGRFVLGIGSQIRPHITKRFSMPWSAPAARMREFILAMRAIWATWHEGKPLEFAGRFYTHTLMTPFFTPTNNEYGAPKVFLAAVGPLMTEVAGEVADGVIVHAFTTEKYLRETTVPALEKGFERAGKSRKDFEISYPVFVVTGKDDQGHRNGKSGDKTSDRVLRIDARVQARARFHRRGSSAKRPQQHVEAGSLGRNGPPDYRRYPQGICGDRRTVDDCGTNQVALWRFDRPYVGRLREHRQRRSPEHHQRTDEVSRSTR